MYYTLASWSDGVQGMILMGFIALGHELAVYSDKYKCGPISGAKSLLEFIVSSQHGSENLEEKSRAVIYLLLLQEFKRQTHRSKGYIAEL
ncbi:hypothetical protein F4776DRAFT_526802 [Hypoxylon sp. NC0597]|nr:hypothetical protein F4776DRAFT_526802 [Hypoxylon sp. NC0597]